MGPLVRKSWLLFVNIYQIWDIDERLYTYGGQNSFAKLKITLTWNPHAIYYDKISNPREIYYDKIWNPHAIITVIFETRLDLRHWKLPHTITDRKQTIVPFKINVDCKFYGAFHNHL